MKTIDRRNSALLIVDFQSRLMPSINEASAAVANAKRLMNAALLFDIPVFLTEQNPKGLGPTIPELQRPGANGIHKMHFDACREEGVLEQLRNWPQIMVAGCEAHVCVQQTVLGLLESGHSVFLVRDAVGARKPESKETAIRRMEKHGAEIVTTEMVVFEWLETADHPRLKEALALVK